MDNKAVSLGEMRTILEALNGNEDQIGVNLEALEERLAVLEDKFNIKDANDLNQLLDNIFGA